MRWLNGLRAHRALSNVVAAVACFALLGYALFAQYGLGLDPCPLCIFQRIGVFALGSAFAVAALLSLARARVAGFVAVFLVVLAAAVTVGVAGRHIYIQSQPPGSIPACGATLGFMWDVFPAVEVLHKVLSGSGECSKIDWRFLGLTMPTWVLMWALALGALGAAVNWPASRVARRW